MVVFLVIFLALLSLNALLLVFSSNRRFRLRGPSARADRPAATEQSYPLASYDSNYQKAV